MSQLSDADQRFLQTRRARRKMGLYVLPASLVALVLGWGAFFVWLPLSVNPFHAIGHFEGQPIEPGTVTTYAVMAALLFNVVFALTAALLVMTIVFARYERRYLKLLESQAEDAPTKAA